MGRMTSHISWKIKNVPNHQPDKWVWVNTYRYIFSGMNIHLPAILMFTRYQGFDTSPNVFLCRKKKNGPSFADAFQGSKLRAAKFSPGRDPSRLNVMLCLNGTDTTGDGNGCIRIYKGYPLVNSHITMERSTIFHGKSHYFDWAIFHSFLYVYQRVNVHQ